MKVLGIDVGDNPRTQRAKRIGPLCSRPLPVRSLEIARRDVIRARVTQYIVTVRARGNVLRSLAEDHRQLRLVVQFLATRNPMHVVEVTDDRCGRLEKHQRLRGRRRVSLLDVRLVIEPDADHLRRGARRKQLQLGQRSDRGALVRRVENRSL